MSGRLSDMSSWYKTLKLTRGHWPLVRHRNTWRSGPEKIFCLENLKQKESPGLCWLGEANCGSWKRNVKSENRMNFQKNSEGGETIVTCTLLEENCHLYDWRSTEAEGGAKAAKRWRAEVTFWVFSWNLKPDDGEMGEAESHFKDHDENQM